jgi:transcriptional regulator
MNIQDKMQEIHHKYGVTEKANYEIQLFVEALLKEQKEQLTLNVVSHRRELLYAFVNTMEFDIKHETYEEDIEYFLKENSSI